jgi:hypothetical protein
MTKVDLDVRRLFSRPSDGFPCDLMAVTPTAVADAVKRGTAVLDELKQSVRDIEFLALPPGSKVSWSRSSEQLFRDLHNLALLSVIPSHDNSKNEQRRQHRSSVSHGGRHT